MIAQKNSNSCPPTAARKADGWYEYIKGTRLSLQLEKPAPDIQRCVHEKCIQQRALKNKVESQNVIPVISHTLIHKHLYTPFAKNNYFPLLFSKILLPYRILYH